MLVVSGESYRRYSHMKVIRKRKQILKNGIQKQHLDLEGAAPGWEGWHSDKDAVAVE
jgi:hypothetical protein